MTNWNDFKFRNLWQHPIWDNFQKSIGRKTWTVKTDDAMAFLIQHKMPFGLNWLEVPRGPLFKDEKSLSEILKMIEDLGKMERAVFVRLSPYGGFRIQDSGFRIPESRIRIAKSDHHPQASLIIDLTKSEEEILSQMKPKGRYNIKVAEKHNVVVTKSGDIDSFYAILSKTANRDGFHVHPKSYYQNMISALGDHAQLLLAEYKGKIIAGGIFVYLDEWGIYYYGASDNEYRNVMAPYIVQWGAIKEAKKRGCKYYDFLGIAPENTKKHPWEGVTEFKKKFGGEVVEYPPAKEMVLRKFWYLIYKIYKSVR